MGIFSTFSGWYRLLTVASVLWIIFVAAQSVEFITSQTFLMSGIFPVTTLWGILWIIRGFKKK